jgi:hypothetical protein
VTDRELWRQLLLDAGRRLSQQPDRAQTQGQRPGRPSAGSGCFPYFTGSNWPRTAPLGLFLVCTLTYHRPAVSCCSCSGVSFAVAWVGLLGALPRGTTTPAFFPASAGPWICAAVTSLLKPPNVTSQVSSCVAVSNVAFASPEPVEVDGGTSADGLSVAWNFSVAADAVPAKVMAKPASSNE